MEVNYHCSLTIHASELTVFLGFQERDLLSMLCKWYDCENRYRKDTIARGEEEIHNVWCNLLGATTPGQLEDALPEGAVGSGFTSRVVFIFEDNKGKTVRKPTLDAQLGDDLLTDLEHISHISGEFSVLPETEEIYFQWYEDAESRRIFDDARLEYYVQRRPTHLWKLAMIQSAAIDSSMVVTPDHMESAIATLLEAEEKMPQVFAGVGS